MSNEQTPENERAFSVPDAPPRAEQSLELPAVIIGDHGKKQTQPRVRILPGRVPESVVLYPAYACVCVASLLASHFAISTGEWNPVMALTGWGLLFSWYWVYGVAYRYRRRLMKYFSLMMATVTAATLVWVSALRSSTIHVPGDAGLVLRDGQPLLVLTAILSALSLAAILAHVVFLGRGYREKVARDIDKGLTESS